MVMYDFKKKPVVEDKYIMGVIPVESVWIALGFISLPLTLCYMFIQMTGGF